MIECGDKRVLHVWDYFANTATEKSSQHYVPSLIRTYIQHTIMPNRHCVQKARRCFHRTSLTTTGGARWPTNNLLADLLSNI